MLTYPSILIVDSTNFLENLPWPKSGLGGPPLYSPKTCTYLIILWMNLDFITWLLLYISLQIRESVLQAFRNEAGNINEWMY